MEPDTCTQVPTSRQHKERATKILDYTGAIREAEPAVKVRDTNEPMDLIDRA
ncbi:hypothetical protein [Actinomyces wuliandei]|uniref:hypothetical protein n=1 Tax=Actinomyces wuliandei TaxID=2057743 RepID=UPI0015D64B24|nr:hypothetical protein [Actinomyces wuliandei]